MYKGGWVALYDWDTINDLPHTILHYLSGIVPSHNTQRVRALLDKTNTYNSIIQIILTKSKKNGDNVCLNLLGLNI